MSKDQKTSKQGSKIELADVLFLNTIVKNSLRTKVFELYRQSKGYII